jgi:glutathione S-transferase
MFCGGASFVDEARPWVSYVLLAASSSFFVNTYHVFLTSVARRASGVKYPATYATEEVAAKDPKAFKFNCGKTAASHPCPVSVSAIGSKLT